MKQTRKTINYCALSIVTTVIVGCVPLQPPPIPEIPLPPPVPQAQTRIIHTVNTSEEGSCGSLQDFVIDAQKLKQKARKELLDQLSSYEGGKFSCDRLKTGLLLSQIGKTVNEDSLAIEILDEYANADQLDEENQQLVQLLLFQSKERKRLHVLLGKLGERLVAQKALSKTMSENLITLQQKMNQLQKLETDINETEQSIATPSTSSLDTETKENTGS